MAYFRIVHARSFNSRGKPKDLAFKPSSDGSGISCVEVECAMDSAGDICSHIVKFYAGVAGDPFIYFVIPENEINSIAPCMFSQKDSTSGDKCHHNLTGLDKPTARNYITRKALSFFRICDGTSSRTLELADIAALTPPTNTLND